MFSVQPAQDLENSSRSDRPNQKCTGLSYCSQLKAELLCHVDADRIFVQENNYGKGCDSQSTASAICLLFACWIFKHREEPRGK